MHEHLDARKFKAVHPTAANPSDDLITILLLTNIATEHVPYPLNMYIYIYRYI